MPTHPTTLTNTFLIHKLNVQTRIHGDLSIASNMQREAKYEIFTLRTINMSGNGKELSITPLKACMY